MSRREFFTSLACLAIVASVPLPIGMSRQDGPLHFRLEHPSDKRYWTEGYVYTNTLLRMFETHNGYNLIFLKRHREVKRLANPL